MNVISNARTWMLYNTIPSLYGHVILLSRAIGCVFLFQTSRKIICDGKKVFASDFIPIFAYLLIEILSTSRSGIIYFLGYSFICVLFLLYKNNKKSKALNKRVFIIVILIAAIVISAFLVLGNLTGKTSMLGVSNMFSVYFGGSIYNLDYYLDNIDSFQSPSFGYFTIPIINSLKKLFGIEVVVLDEFYLPFVPISLKVETGVQTSSNLYSCLTKPILDFGIFGGLVFWFLLGSFYYFFYFKVFSKKGNGFGIVVFSYLMMPVFCSSSEYVYGSFLFSPAALYSVVYLLLVYFSLLKRSPSRIMSKKRNINGYNCLGVSS